MEVSEDYTVFNYGNQRLYKDVKSKDKTIMSGARFKQSPTFILPGNNNIKLVKKIPHMH